MTFILPLSSQDKDPELSQVSLPDPVSFLLSYYLLMGVEGGSLSSESRAHPFPDFILKSHQSRLNPPPPRTAEHSVCQWLSFLSLPNNCLFSRWQLNIKQLSNRFSTQGKMNWSWLLDFNVFPLGRLSSKTALLSFCWALGRAEYFNFTVRTRSLLATLVT